MTATFGANRPIRISLPQPYWDVLFTMAEMQGISVEELATNRLKQVIVEDVTFGEAEEGFYGRLLMKGWRETLEQDEYYKGVTGK